jgi:hypothetical protein
VDRNVAREDAARDSVDDVSRLFLCVARNQPDICHQSQNNENEAENACGNQSQNIFTRFSYRRSHLSSIRAVRLREVEKRKAKKKQKRQNCRVPRAGFALRLLSAAKLWR